MNAEAKRKLENQLMVMGLGGLDDPNLIPQMAMIVNQYGPKCGGHHEFLKGMLGSCEPRKRKEMYDALKPHLMFKPHPLETYIAQVKETAAAGESKSQPIEVGEKKYEEVLPHEAMGAVAEFNCRRCTAFNRYLGKTFVDAVIMGRKEGWTRDLVAQKELCPKCSKIVH